MKRHWIRLILIAPLLAWSLGAAASEEDEEEEEVQTGAGGGAGTGAVPQGDVAGARPHLDEGQRLYLAGNYSEAIPEFQAAYDAWHHPHFLWDIAQSHRRLRHWTQALNFYNRYLREFQQAGMPAAEFPQDVYIHVADCLFALNRPDEAVQSLQRYVSQYPQGRYRDLAQQCIQQRQAPSAVDRRDPATVRQARQIHDEATALHQRQQYREAAERFLEGYRQYGNITEFLYNAAASYRAGRMWRDAIRTYGQYLQTPGASPEAYIELAQCHNALSQLTEAVAAYRRYLQAEPNGTFADDARQYIQTVTAASSGGSPPSADVHQRAREAFERGVAHYEAGRYEQAQREFQASYDIMPTRVTIYNIALCYRDARQWQRALTNFENYLRGGDTGRYAQGHLGAAQCLIELNQPAEARRHIETYLRRADQAELPNEEAHRRFAQSLLARCGGGSSE